jgi:hypothetical protein
MVFEKKVCEAFEKRAHWMVREDSHRAMSDTRTYPIYRQLAGGGHLYRVESPYRFTELQRIGGRWVKHTIQAVAYPEMVRIHELVEGEEGRYVALDADQWRIAEARVVKM